MKRFETSHRCRPGVPGDGWGDAHDFIASTVFGLVSLAGISGTMEPRGIFSMAVPAEVLAALHWP